ncbi:hypothetical protein ADICYQ_4828 [Cyclobacterium qasimii M12-11B]|uniref:Uncharacterized protein n=1 Tax=Cyclobacterium qasimii M12-11B TaxID=641524 RepID=S7V7E0_9BACT|nr:hypothetical protein ADICYQ_4828 [Cyclobacterium qasimii M12-11B]
MRALSNTPDKPDSSPPRQEGMSANFNTLQCFRTLSKKSNGVVELKPNFILM